MLRICLFAAILFGIAVGALNFTMVKDKITTIRQQREDEKSQKEAAQKDARETHQKLTKTEGELKSTQETLKTTTEERDRAVADAADKAKKLATTTDERDKARKERDDAQAELAAYQGTGLKPEQIVAMNKQYKALEDENKQLAQTAQRRQQQIVKLNNRLSLYEDREYIVPLPAGLKGKVLITDPKWSFVVLNIGQDQGVKEQGELLVNRNGKLVAKVRVRSVQQNRSIANVVQGWQLGDVMEGDQVIPAHPEVTEDEHVIAGANTASNELAR
jgi:myosin heavy subunit